MGFAIYLSHFINIDFTNTDTGTLDLKFFQKLLFLERAVSVAEKLNVKLVLHITVVTASFQNKNYQTFVVSLVKYHKVCTVLQIKERSPA